MPLCLPKVRPLSFRPDRRNYIFAFLSIPLLAWAVYLSRKISIIITQLEDKNVQLKLTYLTVVIAWGHVSVLTPLHCLHHIYKGCVRTTTNTTRAFLISRFKLHWPWRQNIRESTKKVAALIDYTSRLAVGEQLQWQKLPILSQNDRELVRELVEENITIRRDNNTIVETSTWVLIFSHLFLCCLILLAGDFAGLQALEEGLTEDYQIGKVLAEWLANYVLLLVGFLQITSQWTWLYALNGFCFASVSAFTSEELKSLVALYIAMAEEPIVGLKRNRSYAKVRMNGKVWTAPKVSSALLVGLGEPFVVKWEEQGWRIMWGEHHETHDVRMVGGD